MDNTFFDLDPDAKRHQRRVYAVSLICGVLVSSYLLKVLENKLEWYYLYPAVLVLTGLLWVSIVCAGIWCYRITGRPGVIVVLDGVVGLFSDDHVRLISFPKLAHEVSLKGSGDFSLYLPCDNRYLDSLYTIPETYSPNDELVHNVAGRVLHKIDVEAFDSSLHRPTGLLQGLYEGMRCNHLESSVKAVATIMIGRAYKDTLDYWGYVPVSESAFWGQVRMCANDLLKQHNGNHPSPFKIWIPELTASTVAKTVSQQSGMIGTCA